MNAERKPSPETREQVDAFMAHLQDRLEIDEAHLKRVTKRNGEFVTVAWVLTLLIGLVSFLGVRQLNYIVDEIYELRAKQIDVRERLRILEELYRRHAEAK